VKVWCAHADEMERVFGNRPFYSVNNAGVRYTSLVSNASWQDWDWANDVNINGVFNGVRTFSAAQRGMAKARIFS